MVTVKVTDVVGIFVHVLTPFTPDFAHDPELGVTVASLTRFPLTSLIVTETSVVIGRNEIVAEEDPVEPIVTVENPDSYCCVAETGEVATKEYEPVAIDALTHCPFGPVSDVQWLTLIPAIGEPSTELTTVTVKSAVATVEVKTTVAPFLLTSDHVGVTLKYASR